MMIKEERLQKVIANRGYCSRRRAETLIQEGRVKVDGQKITEMGHVVPIDVNITIDNQPVVAEKQKVYFLFYKPRAVITTMFDPKKRKTVADFFKDVNERVYPVGRLDYDVSGLLIMTNDGEFANFVMHPRYEFMKTYQALINGKVDKKQIKQLKDGVIIDDNYKTSAIESKLLNYDADKNESIVELTIAEGKKHHVKKMLEAAGMDLHKLMRTKIEDIEIGNLKPGQYRPLKPHEIKHFYGVYKSTRRKGDL